MRAGEAWNLKWTDLDPEQRTINISPEKNSKPRRPQIFAQLVSMLNALPKRYKLIFRNPDIDPLKSAETFRRIFYSSLLSFFLHIKGKHGFIHPSVVLYRVQIPADCRIQLAEGNPLKRLGQRMDSSIGCHSTRRNS